MTVIPYFPTTVPPVVQSPLERKTLPEGRVNQKVSADQCQGHGRVGPG